MIDDGSTDRTVEVAREHGVDHIVRLTNNKGLAAAFQAGLDACLKLGADVIVNTDADNQYRGADVAKLVAPILAGRADMVVGDRQVAQIEHFSGSKKAAAAARQLGRAAALGTPRSPTPPPASAPTTARRRCSCSVVSNFTYTLESLIQAGKHAGRGRRRRGRHQPADRASRACSPRPAPTCAATRPRSSASTPATSRCAPSPPPRAVLGVLALAAWMPFLDDWISTATALATSSR